MPHAFAGSPQPQPSRFALPVWAFVISLMGLGLIARLAPLLSPTRLLRQFPTEDGYLMLTMARNIALGKGLSTAEGTIPTNGTQPLFTLIQALGFWMAGGNKVAGVAIAQVLGILISLGAAALLYVLGRQVLQRRPQARAISAVTAVLWFASSTVVPHSMNCLETGLYGLLVLGCVWLWYCHQSQPVPRLRFHWGFALQLGVLLGVTFWARNDAIFLVAALILWHPLLGMIRKPYHPEIPRRLGEGVVIGLTSLAVVSPWLIYNYTQFGSIIPISGPAQSLDITLGQNLLQFPAALFEYMGIVLPIPATLTQWPPVLAITTVLVGVYAVWVAIALVRLMHPQERLLSYGVATYCGLILVYYGIFFGAPHFVSRYLFPLSPFFALFTVALLAGWLNRQSVKLQRRLSYLGLGLLVLLLMLHLRLYRLGMTHEHFQVVRWAEENVPASTWVGAVQTGTLGFFHDRTINLDGKVNPQALAARREQQIPTYVVETVFDPAGGQIDYLIDWVGIAGWIELEPIRSHFRLLIQDEQQNLAVLQRSPRPSDA